MKFFIFLFCISIHSFAQFAPPVGQTGTTAIDANSSVFVNWANACIVVRGYSNISNPSAGYATAGKETAACGKALENGVISLGDGGYAIVTFPFGIKNGDGPDFAVFENSFSNDFLELAFVEVSSDGTNYFRFPATSNTQTNTQIATFDLLDASKINNLAGKYILGYGTPFDLEELKNEPGLDVNKITHIKIIDVVGSINASYGTKDSNGNFINDPFPTEFPTGGFDLDAVGVIHQNSIAGFLEQNKAPAISFYPNPAKANEAIYIETTQQTNTNILIYDCLGSKIIESKTHSSLPVKVKLKAGVYFITTATSNNIYQTQKLIVSE